MPTRSVSGQFPEDKPVPAANRAPPDVTTHSDTRSRSSAPRSQTGSSKQTRGFRSAHLGLSGGRSETIVESQVRDGSNDAASENSESAIIVKTTVDVSNSHRLKDV